MNSFAKRMAAAIAHERQVCDALRVRGWTAEPFGQGQVSEPLRQQWRKVPTLSRWMADIIAAKTFPSRTLVVFIDAKAGIRYRNTGNHDIEVSALESAEKWIEFSGDECPYYFVFKDGSVATPGMVRELAVRGTYRDSGSGTPFVLIPAVACRPFDSIFGIPARQGAFV